MKKALLAVALSILAFLYANLSPSNAYIYDRVVQIKNEAEATCSGVQIHTSKGADYILTAGHCLVVVEGGGWITDEAGNRYQATIVEEDPESDLLLLQGIAGLRGLDIAPIAWAREEIRTFSHGHSFKAYETAGTLIQTMDLNAPIFQVKDDASYFHCASMPKYHMEMSMVGPICVMSVEETVTTAFVTGGSSGGAAVDGRGRLVGVVSAVGEGFGFLVRLEDIRRFLAAY